MNHEECGAKEIIKNAQRTGHPFNVHSAPSLKLFLGTSNRLSKQHESTGISERTISRQRLQNSPTLRLNSLKCRSNPLSGAVSRRGLRKIRNFRLICRYILETA